MPAKIPLMSAQNAAEEGLPPLPTRPLDTTLVCFLTASEEQGDVISLRQMAQMLRAGELTGDLKALMSSVGTLMCRPSSIPVPEPHRTLY